MLSLFRAADEQVATCLFYTPEGISFFFLTQKSKITRIFLAV